MTGRVRDRREPDRVPVWPVVCARVWCRIASRPVSAIPTIARLCGADGRASRRPVVCHVPAQHGALADAARSGLRTFILLSGRGVLSWCVRRRG